MARQYAARKPGSPPRRVYPRLRGAFADAVFVYLPAVAFFQARNHRLGIDNGVLPLWNNLAGQFMTFFDDCSIKALSGTLGLDFTNGMTVLTVGSMRVGDGNGIRNLINRGNASTTGGFNVNYYNGGGTGAKIFSSYNKPAVGDTNWDSAWVNGVKDGSGNGSFTTVDDVVYAFAGTTATGPAASVTTEFIMGKESIAGQPGGQTSLAMVVIWPRKFPEGLMARITADPLSIFQPQLRFGTNTISADVTVGLTGLSSTTSIVGPGTTVSPNAALAAVSATGSMGAVLAEAATALSGFSSTTSINAMPVGIATAALVSGTITGTQGTVTYLDSSGNLTIGVTGVSSTGSVGTAGVSISKALDIRTIIANISTVTSSGGTMVSTGLQWRSVAFHSSVAGFSSVTAFTSITGNSSV